MKKLNSVSMLLLAMLLLMLACRKNNNVIEEKEISVSLYNCKDVKRESNIRICYDSLINESRCPEDVICIWPGYAMIKVSFSENGNLHRFQMLYMIGNTRHYNQLGAVSDTIINGYQIKLVNVLPYPKASGPRPINDQHKALFTISR